MTSGHFYCGQQEDVSIVVRQISVGALDSMGAICYLPALSCGSRANGWRNMKRNVSLWTALAVGALCMGCVDQRYLITSDPVDGPLGRPPNPDGA